METCTYRTCRICLQSKPEDEFSENGRKRAKENRCKPCVNAASAVRRKLKKTAPPKPETCECCGQKTEKMCLDHCHDALTFRGWLCESCNRGIGQLGDNIEGLQRAINYLSKDNV